MNALPRVVSAQAVAGFGKCGLGIALPVISSCGAEVCPLPTAVLSANTSFPKVSLTDISSKFSEWLESWGDIGFEADALCSGFLSSPDQAEPLLEMRRILNPKLVLVDPAMADHGRLYRTCTDAHVAAQRRLIKGCDVTTPNLTELCLLTDRDYRPDLSPDDIALAAEAHGAPTVAVTGIERGEELRVGLYDGDYRELRFKRLDFSMHGTGDLFASVLIGGLVTGHSPKRSLISAAEFTAFVMEQSRLLPDFPRRGLCFEPYLHMLSGGVFSSI